MGSPIGWAAKRPTPVQAAVITAAEIFKKLLREVEFILPDLSERSKARSLQRLIP
jgi:hypothetical protein